jgi:hypothetical protein
MEIGTYATKVEVKMDEKTKEQAKAKLAELEALLGDMSVEEFIKMVEEEETSEPESENEMTGEETPETKGNPMKIAVMIARMKKHAA